MAKYVTRIARLPEVFRVLAAYPDGRRVDDLAAEVGVPVKELREDLLAFYSADVGPDVLMGLSRPEVLEFLGPDGADEDPNVAEVVRIVDPRPADELGVEYVDAAELALVHTAARMELEKEWSQDLADAIEVLETTMLGDAAGQVGRAAVGQSVLGRLQAAQRDRRRVRLTYSRAWRHGLSERVVEPFALVQTRRGWEVDAGLPEGGLRTFLLSNVRDLDVLEETFEPPADLAEQLAAQRATEAVVVRLPQGSRWVADMYAEEVRVVEEGEDAETLELDLLPPLGQRVGMLLLVAGPRAELVGPADLAGSRARLAEELKRHHTG